MPVLSEARRLRQLVYLAKRHGWRDVALVGINGSREAQQLHFGRRLNLLAVATPRPHLTPRERLQQVNAMARLAKLAGLYERFQVITGDPAVVVRQLGERTFDAVILWEMSAVELTAAGAPWAELVRHGGMLVGTDHRDEAIRRVLKIAVPDYTKLADGIWTVKVERSEGDPAEAAVKVDPVPVGVDDVAGAIIPDGGSVVLADDEVVIADSVTAPSHEPSDAAPAVIAPKRRGRPPGSKSKTKTPKPA